MQNSIVRGFGSILRFSGRDTRSEFWPFAAAAVALYLLIGLPVGTATLPDIRADPLNAGDNFLLASAAMFVALVSLLAAAVARRLHDSGTSAFWGLLPLPFVVYDFAVIGQVNSQFEAGGQNLRLFYSGFASTILYFVAVAWLVVLLARRSALGPNRFS